MGSTLGVTLDVIASLEVAGLGLSGTIVIASSL
jgi:hypothetical protein